MGSMSIVHWLVVGGIVLLLFGSGKLTSIAGDAEKSIMLFKREMNHPEGE